MKMNQFSRRMYFFALVLNVILLAGCKKESQETTLSLPENLSANLQNISLHPNSFTNSKITALGSSFGFFHEGKRYYVSFRTRSEATSNAEITFSTTDVIDPATSKYADDLGTTQTVAFRPIKKIVVTIKFNSKATKEDTFGVQTLTLTSTDDTFASIEPAFSASAATIQEYASDATKFGTALKATLDNRSNFVVYANIVP